jgi:hypothetical protein
MRIADIEARDANGNVVLVAEVKSRANKTPEWAAQLRRNLLSHGQPLANYFLIVTPDRTFLWHEGKNQSIDARQPDWSAETKRIIGPRLAEAIVRPGIDSRGLEHLISAWLSRVAHSDSPDEFKQPARDFLQESGLFEALRGATVQST